MYSDDKMEFEFMKWLGHASFVFEENGRTVYIDPFKIKDAGRKADIILVTHPHFDHLYVESIKMISKSSTKVYVTKDSIDKLRGHNVTGVSPFEEYDIEGMKISTVPAYNVVKERLDKHPKANGWVGYVIETNGRRIYHAGDTDEIPEMKNIRADLALLPMGGTYTMDIDEVISAAGRISASHVAPIHYKALLGKDAAHEAEKKFLSSVRKGIVLDEEDPAYSF